MPGRSVLGDPIIDQYKKLVPPSWVCLLTFDWSTTDLLDLFIYLGFYVAFNTVQVISRRVVGRAEETSTYSSLGFCTVNCRPTASNYQLSHLRPCKDRTPASEVPTSLNHDPPFFISNLEGKEVTSENVNLTH